MKHKQGNLNIGQKKSRKLENVNQYEIESVAEDELNLEDQEYEFIVNSLMGFSRESKDQHIFLIQPFIKWGPRKSATHPDLLLEESESLIKTLPNWAIVASVKVALESLDKKYLFGKGKLDELKTIVSNEKRVSCLFISKSTLTITQKQTLEREFRLPILDRYSVVVQILRNHATTTEAKLQVAMAELPYIWTQMRDTSGLANQQGNFILTDTQKELLRNREKKIKTALKNVRSHRELLRKRRSQRKFPVIAVVGYTNAGKTSLIKALTEEQSLVPRDQLFATLDVTAHAGMLPSKMQVIYMDTVGFMADLPTGLIECFVATLEDAILADLVIHVQDVSHPNFINQRDHVETTLKSLYLGYFSQPEKCYEEDFKPRIINVGNKIDKVQNLDRSSLDGYTLVSSKTMSGLSDLTSLVEQHVMNVTDSLEMLITVPMGGAEAAWLYKNATVVDTEADPEDSQNLVMRAIILEENYYKFRHTFRIEGKLC